MKWPKLGVREKALSAITALVIFAAFNYMVVMPWIDHCREHRDQLVKQGREARFREEFIRHIPDWRRELAALAQPQEAVPPHAASQEAWMKHFEEMARQSGVELKQRNQKLGEGKGRPNQLRVECGLQGNFEGVARFLFKLQQDSSHPQVVSCQISPVKAGEPLLRGQFSILAVLKPGGAENVDMPVSKGVEKKNPPAGSR
ncbi:MAG: hypothetical protein PHV34_09550 [Verrucomicrobiae bacterium]|nr:hypothetical protein [Verrucomicrobiae bacterium]